VDQLQLPVFGRPSNLGSASGVRIFASELLVLRRFSDFKSPYFRKERTLSSSPVVLFEVGLK
jgi:hypothetical protein